MKHSEAFTVPARDRLLEGPHPGALRVGLNDLGGAHIPSNGYESSLL